MSERTLGIEQNALDVAALRSRFPALSRRVDGAPCIYADAPGGTQVPDTVVEAMTDYLARRNANSGGAFVTSEETDSTIAAARRAGAALLGCMPDEVVFGANMTTLAFALSRSLARKLSPGDEVVVTVLDHDANVSPWVAAAEDAGARVRWVDIDARDCTLDLDRLEEVLSERTRIVAFTVASNAVGTVTPAAEVVRRARRTEAVVIADAVHLAPHRAIDVRALGVDVLLCSPYKFFGPHMGVMFGTSELLQGLRPYKVRPAHDDAPDRWETGTKNHEALAGLMAAVDYLAEVGGAPTGSGAQRAAVAAGMNAIRRAEATLTHAFLDRIAVLDRVQLYGIADPARCDERTPTFALRTGDVSPREAAERLGRAGIFTWDGNYYALALMERLGLEESGGALRIGFCHLNTLEEVERVAAEVAQLIQR
ncbi:MAG TPA: cysteine desulfurase-like protein [Actinomycetota bacterium]|nr:cysteine desulfurase-like protein [Actinomycetota bacterium]